LETGTAALATRAPLARVCCGTIVAARRLVKAAFAVAGSPVGRVPRLARSLPIPLLTARM
jgi:hypothetical protein